MSAREPCHVAAMEIEGAASSRLDGFFLSQACCE
jgi:hypothetical protein